MKLVIALGALLLGTALAAPSVVLTQPVMKLVRESALLSKMAYDPAPNATGFSSLKNFLVEPDQAIVAKHNGYCFGAFRGTTMTWTDWSQNFDPGSVDACVDIEESTRCCTTRHGFFEAYMTSYRDEFERDVRECAKSCTNPDECVVLTGHSQGGAIAALAGLYLADLNPYVITFGQPYTIDAPCDMVTSERWYRFVNTKFGSVGISYDPVPFVPGLGADAFGHMMLVSNDDTGVSYIGLDAQDSFGPLNVGGFEAHSMVGTNEHPGYLDRIDAIISHEDYPVRTNGYVGGSACTENKECESNQCSKETTFSYSRCVSTECRIDADCETGRCDSGLCMPKLGSCMSCDEDSDCESGKCPIFVFKCAGDDGLMDNKCMCMQNSDCTSGRCEGTNPRICEAQLGEGGKCNEDSDCKSYECNWMFKCSGGALAGTKGTSAGIDLSNRSHTASVHHGKINTSTIIIIGVVVAAVVGAAGLSIYKKNLAKRSGYDTISMDV
uniref:Fungal lipase-type domain-containing protein n=1 Tax=Odontella aurita TaxID=265563 RepID=A0A7S4NAS7_9STRA|mmetsp:Transcript_55150/g.165209  ORF Transcript_55150/g.165209 Transcript_55150/m.165209 type:complete len:496 (+) Transcript_55150:153-1640(+)